MKSTRNKTISVAGIDFTLLFEHLLPSISAEEYERLKKDIAANGVVVPVAVDEKMGIIDGINRLRAASELGQKTVPFFIHHNVSMKDKRELAISLNAHRRHWSKEERLTLAVSLRKGKYSFRRIAEVLNLSHETVRRHLTALGDSEDFPEKTVGKDGVERPAKGRTPRTIIKSSKELKRAFNELDGVSGLKLGDAIMDARGLSKKIRDHKHDAIGKDCHQDVEIGQATLLVGDFIEKGKSIPEESVDMIFTDPPYAKDDLQLWDDLGRFAQRVLKKGGILLSYSGNMYLPEVYEMLGRHLEYFWTFAIRHTGACKTVYPVNVHQSWKPVLGYFKPPFNKAWKCFPDMVSGGQSKDYHKWEQPLEEAQHFIKSMCPRAGVLVDPMMGSGSSILAGMALGTNCTGIEIDTTAFATARQRVEHLQEKLGRKVA